MKLILYSFCFRGKKLVILSNMNNIKFDTTFYPHLPETFLKTLLN